MPATQIEVPAEAPSRRTIEYEEVWRTDPDSDEYLIGRVGKVAIDDNGNLYVFEHQLTEILKFDAEGEYLGIIVRKGQGPGEIERLSSMTFWPPDTLVLTGGFPPRTVRVSTDGVPQDGLHVYRDDDADAEATVNAVVPVGDHAVIRSSSLVMTGMSGHSNDWVGVIDREGRVLLELGSTVRPFEVNLKVREYDELARFWAWQRWTAVSPGYVFVAPEREKWLIERRTLDGAVDLVMRRDVAPHRRTPEELAERDKAHGDPMRRMGQEFKGKFAETDPPVLGLTVIDGQLWVPCSTRGEERRKNQVPLFEVFTVDGELIEQVKMSFDLRRERDSFYHLQTGQLVIVENGSAAWSEELARTMGEVVDEESDAPVIVMYREKR